MEFLLFLTFLMFFQSAASMQITEDYITWKIHDQPFFVQINETQMNHHFSIYSDSPFKLLIKDLSNEKGEHHLGWKNGTLVEGEDLAPLPPFTEHLLEMKCDDPVGLEMDCILMINKIQTLGPIKCTASECKMSVQAEDGDSFLWIYHRGGYVADVDEVSSSHKAILFYIGILIFGFLIWLLGINIYQQIKKDGCVILQLVKLRYNKDERKGQYIMTEKNEGRFSLVKCIWHNSYFHDFASYL